VREDQEEQLKQESAFASMGKQVLDNEAFKQAITIRKAQIFEVFCKTKADQQDVREEAWRTMQNMTALEEFFRIALETGRMADKSLEQLEQMNKNKS